MKSSLVYLFWLARLAATVILVQAVLFKMGGQPESIYIFHRLGMESWGRLGAGAIEFVAAVLILIPHTSWLGAFIGLSSMLAAISTHLTVIGLDVLGDDGYMFFLACVVAINCATILWLTRLQWQCLVRGSLI